MNQTQFQAGYLLESINETLKNFSKNKEVKGLLKYLSCFDIVADCNFFSNSRNPFVAVIHNLISRGIPTRPSIFIENKFLETFQKSKIDCSDFAKQLGNIKYLPLFSQEENKDIFSALHIIDPRLKLTENNYGVELESSFEKDFIFKYMPKNELGFLQQLLESQRKLNTIVTPEIGYNFHSQRVDFSYEFPYVLEDEIEIFGEKKIKTYNQGLIIEIDGAKFHTNPLQTQLDRFRDKSVKETKWITKRISDFRTTDFGNWIKRSNSLKIINDNYNKTIKNNWLDILQLTLSPFAIARIQKTIIELILSGNLDLNAKEWNILAIERDVPCFSLAIEDLRQQFHQIFSLAGIESNFPIVNFQVLSTEEFINSKLHYTKPELFRNFQNEKEFDLIIDISILQRSGITKTGSLFNGKVKIIIRSSHYVNSERKIYTSDMIDYKPITVKLENETYQSIEKSEKSLTYFLQNIFRKEGFREGQLPILNRALQGKSVIGLLPTGGGKSLTYQLASLLQPGVTMVIDPIKSLMQDQYDNLVKNGIDSCNFINSKLTREEKTIATNQVAESKVIYTFISPERLQIEDFRISLKEMHKNNVYFSYCVIDEVHCVSEWGHDFRTSYLSLGRNAIEHCKPKNKKYIPILGLTATASFDVLSDVERELSGNGLTDIDTDAIVRFENTNRTELQYQIVNTKVDFVRDEDFKIRIDRETEIELPFQPIKGVVKYQVGEAKQTELLNVIEKIPNNISALNSQSNHILEWTKEKFPIEGELPNIKIENFETDTFFNLTKTNNKSIYKNGGIVFCPHKTHLFGVTDKFKFEKYDDDVRDENGNIIHRWGEPLYDENGNRVRLPLEKRKGIADILTRKGNLDVGVFMGSSDEDELVGKEIETESFENQRKFIENEQNVMVATKAFGMGIDKPNVRFTVHINIPASIESFVQEAGRAGRDKKMALSTILFNEQKVAIFNQKFYENIESEVSEETFKLLKKLKNQKFFKDEIPNVLKALKNEELIQNEKKIIENLGEIFIDKDNLLFFHNNSFKGQEKELVVINELLQEILLPNKNKLWFLSEELNEETGEEGLRLSVFLNYLNIFDNNNGKIGGINLINLNRSFHRIVCIQEYSNQIINVVISKIRDKHNELNNVELLKNWLEVSENETSENGIEKRLTEIDFHQEVEPEIIIPFANKYADKNVFHEEFKTLFKTTITDKASDDVILKSIEGTFENYLKTVKGKLNIEIELNEEALQRLKQLYYSPRKKPDTDKAIFRLTSIGIIDDYTVDYNKNCYKIRIVKKTDEEYKEQLKMFMRKYYSANRVNSEITKVDKAEGNTILQKCLSFLTYFVYNEIEAKRKRAIDDMVLACEYGLKENGNEELKEFIYLYFNSKYARQNYSYKSRTTGEEISASLSSDIADKDFSFKILWKYINAINDDNSGAQVNNVKHLRGATLLLLRDGLDNGALHLLKSFTLFVTGFNKNQNLITEARESLVTGFKLFKEKYTALSFEKLAQNIERYNAEIIENANDSEEVSKILNIIIEELYLEFHNDWLKNFNQKYLLEYDR